MNIVHDKRCMNEEHASLSPIYFPPKHETFELHTILSISQQCASSILGGY